MLQRGILRRITNDRFQVGRHATHKSHVVPDQLLPNLSRRFPDRITDDDHGSACHERHKRLLNRSIESTRNNERRSETPPYVKIFSQCQQLVDETGVLDRHAFWGSGGAGGVDDVGEDLRPHGTGGSGLRAPRDRLPPPLLFPPPPPRRPPPLAPRRVRPRPPPSPAPPP